MSSDAGNSTISENESLTGTLGGAPLSVVTTVSSFIAVAWYNVLVINVVVLLVFKRWSGLYFYSLMIASWGIVLHQLGFLMQFFGIAKVFAESYVVMMVGWYTMTTGQAVVLYSRLHLVARDRKKFRWVLYMIAIDALLFHVPTTILLALTNSKPELTPPFQIWQNIQVTAFSIQEFILAGLYIWEAKKALKPYTGFRKNRYRRVMRNLIYVNVLVIVLDIAVMCTQYAGWFGVHVVFKAAVYSVKLFVEFFVLNQLTEVTMGGSDGSGTGDPHHMSTFPAHLDGPHASAVRTNVSHGPTATNRSADDDDDQTSGYSSFGGKGATHQERSEADSRNGVYRTTEVVITSEYNNETGQPTGRESDVPRRRKDEWIELD